MSKIIAYVKGIFFATKIAETAKQNNEYVTFVKNESELFDQINKNTELIIFDLNNKFLNLDIIKVLRRNRSLSKLEIIGFLSHVDIELRQKAIDIGFDKIYARSEFSKKLAEII